MYLYQQEIQEHYLTGATLIVGRIKGIDRPALAGILPAYKSQLLLIDAGSNTNCKPINLLQFAQMSTYILKKYIWNRETSNRPIKYWNRRN